MKTIQTNVVYTSDNLPVMAALPDECVDLVYLDPPWNTSKKWSNIFNLNGKRVKSSFIDIWTLQDINDDDKAVLEMEYPKAADIAGTLGRINGAKYESYLINMGARLAQIRRILKPTGSVYYHCDSRMSHSVKLMMDSVFGKQNFRNEIIWFYPAMSAAKNHFPKKNDILLFYSKGDDYTFNGDAVREPYDEKTTKRYKNPVVFPGGYVAKENPLGRLPYTVWQIPPIRNTSKEKTGYPTQKPEKLLERIIKASSSEGDVVLDPFCGCATACVMAHTLKRRWVGIDMGDIAIDFVVDRINKHNGALDGRLDLEEMKAKGKKKPKLPDLSSLPIYKPLKDELREEQKGKCNGCKKLLDRDDEQIDHIVSRVRGGPNKKYNLQILCGKCNRIKHSDMSMRELIAKRRAELLQRSMDDYYAERREVREKELAKARK